MKLKTHILPCLAFVLLATALPPPAPAAEPGPVAAPALAVTGFFPAAGATDVCPDTPLRLTFNAPPALAPAGKIQILDATDTVVDTIDVSLPTATKSIGGVLGFKFYPVIITGNTVALFPRPGVLAYGKTYHVTADPGVFRTADGTDATGLGPSAAWRFTTKPAAPAADAARLTVAADGTGDFCTVQGAFDFIPDGNTKPLTVFIRKGTYPEIIVLINKHAITLLGEDRQQTVIAYANNANFNPDLNGNPFGGTAPDPGASVPARGGSIYRRGLFLAHRVDDLTVANLTFHNTTRQGGSQAECVILNGSATAHAIFKDVDFFSYQDTVQFNGQTYVSNCHMEGDVDFMWGKGPAFFDNCTARSLRAAAFTQVRNPATNHGFVFLHSTFECTAGGGARFLSRVPAGRFPNSEVVLLDCMVTGNISPAAWQLQGGDMSAAHFWDFNSHDAAGLPLDVSSRFAGSRQLKQPDDAATIMDYSNPAFVLGHDWNPRLAPIFK